MTCQQCGKPGHWAQDCCAPVWHIGEGEELHPPDQEQDRDSNEELPQDLNDTSDSYYEEGHGHDVSYMEESWNNYDYDNNWDWNDNSYEDAANYSGGINESHLTIGHVRQAKSLPCKHKPKSLLAKKTSHTTSWNDYSKSFQQFLQEDTTQLHFDIEAATQKQRQKKTDDNITHYIMYSNFKSYHHLLIDSGASTHVPKGLRYDLVENQFHSSTLCTNSKKIPVYGIKYVSFKPILSASRLLDRGYGLDFDPRHCTITHRQQQAHLTRHPALFYLRTTDNGKSIAVIQPTEKATRGRLAHHVLFQPRRRPFTSMQQLLQSRLVQLALCNLTLCNLALCNLALCNLALCNLALCNLALCHLAL